MANKKYTVVSPNFFTTAGPQPVGSVIEFSGEKNLAKAKRLHKLGAISPLVEKLDPVPEAPVVPNANEVDPNAPVGNVGDADDKAKSPAKAKK